MCGVGGGWFLLLFLLVNVYVDLVTKFVDENRVPHLLFYGPAGTGKTSTILALARRMYGAAYSSNVVSDFSFFRFCFVFSLLLGFWFCPFIFR